MLTATFLVFFVGVARGAVDEYMATNPRPLTNVVFESTPARVERGRYLAEGVLRCFMCHAERDYSQPGAPVIAGTEGVGSIIFETDEELLVASNITPDKATGAGTWSDDMLARAIREGVGHDGRTLAWQMPYGSYRRLSDEDLQAVVVYLRTLPPVQNKLPARRLSPETARRSIRHSSRSVGSIPSPDMNDPIIRGEYLLKAGECRGCHTGWYHRNPGFLGGGNNLTEVAHSRAENLFSTNISSDLSGIGAWPPEAFAIIMRSGKGGLLEGVMPWQALKNMSDEDLAAILTFIKSTPPVKHYVINRSPASWCEVCEQSHGGGGLNKITPLVPFDASYNPPWNLAGEYINAAGKAVVTISRIDGQWMLSTPKTKPTPLVAMAANKFQAKGFMNFISFRHDQSGYVTHLLTSGWNDESYARKE